MRRGAPAAVAILAALALVPVVLGATPRGATTVDCSSAYVAAVIGGDSKCLHAGEFCAAASETDYERYGFACIAGRLQQRSSSTSTSSASSGAPRPATLSLGTTMLLGARTAHAACRRGVLPDRRCSPGAYYSGITRVVLCSTGFHTSAIRSVSQSEKFAVEGEYGMPARLYGRTIELDHIVPLELGGSNDEANIFPEPGSGPASYHAKDKLENRLHALVCSGSMTLAAAQRGIAMNWKTLYRRVFGVST